MPKLHKKSKLLSERGGGSVQSERTYSDQVQKSTLAASSLNERLRNKKEGVLVSRNEF